MNENFKTIEPQDIDNNVFTMLGKEWMLITGGSSESFNTMTASWGGFGVMWHKNVINCVVRPTRYTYEFIENSDCFTLSFLEDGYKDALKICGSTSGRDSEKVKKVGLTPFDAGQKSVAFEESKIILVCKKLYYHDINPENFIDVDDEKFYPKKDYHRMYIAEIVKVLKKR